MKKINPVVWAVLAVPVIYMAIVLACSYEAGINLFALMERFGLLLGRPDLLRWTAYTPRCILGVLVCYGLAVTLYYADCRMPVVRRGYGIFVSWHWRNPGLDF